MVTPRRASTHSSWAYKSATQLLILSVRNPGDCRDTPGGGAMACLAEEGQDAILDVVVAPGPSDQVTTACEDVMQEASKQRMAT